MRYHTGQGIIMKYKLHKLRSHRIYGIWCNMKTRCYNPQPNHHHYKNKNIIVCDEWKTDVRVFWEWSQNNGYSDELSIDRIDTGGNYEPSNCRWVNKTVQARNRCVSIGKKYKGTRKRHSGRYESRLGISSKNIHLGTFDTEEEAAIAYNEYVIKNDTGHSLNILI